MEDRLRCYAVKRYTDKSLCRAIEEYNALTKTNLVKVKYMKLFKAKVKSGCCGPLARPGRCGRFNETLE